MFCNEIEYTKDSHAYGSYQKPKVFIFEKFDLQKGIHKLKYTIYSPKSGFKNMRLRWICLGHK